jgi:hypothetical protein
MKLACLPSALPAILFSSLTLFAAVPVAAQTASRPPASTAVFTPPLIDNFCPVSMQAQHLAGMGMMQARDQYPKGIGQRLTLTLTGRDSRQIASATVAVHGLNGKSRVTEALSTRNPSSDAIATLVVPFAGTAGETASARIWVPGMTAVQTIDLKSVTYADGGTLSLDGIAACRIVPDPLMLIAGQ